LENREVVGFAIYPSLAITYPTSFKESHGDALLNRLICMCLLPLELGHVVLENYSFKK